MPSTPQPIRTPVPPELIALLSERFGERLTTARAALESHGRGETFHQPFDPDAVVFPDSAEEVAEVVSACARHRVPVIPFGVGTSVEGNFAALNGGVCIDMSRMDRITRVSPDDLDCTVQAGVTREQLNAHLRDTGLFFPIDPGANATIGGMASTRASGTNAVRYGTMRENVLALTVVTPEGKIIETSRRARKSAAGYDLTRLYVGSEGTLGVITDITLKLYGVPEAIASAVCPFETIEGAVATVVQLIQIGVPIARVEILDDVQMRAINAWSKTDYAEANTLFFEFHGSRAHVDEQVSTVKELAIANGGGDFQWAEQAEDRSRLWKARHEAYYAAVGLRPGAQGWATDVCVPISRLAECITLTKRDLESASIPGPILGHVGDGNFHVVFVLDPNNPAEFEEAERLNERLVGRALEMGGTCTGEHGVGWGKIDWLEAELGEALDVMRALKRAIDPLNIMNPGKIVRLGNH
jgi:D-lactate dehydrogenase (cytochrome)